MSWPCCGHAQRCCKTTGHIPQPVMSQSHLTSMPCHPWRHCWVWCRRRCWRCAAWLAVSPPTSQTSCTCAMICLLMQQCHMTVTWLHYTTTAHYRISHMTRARDYITLVAWLSCDSTVACDYHRTTCSKYSVAHRMSLLAVPSAGLAPACLVLVRPYQINLLLLGPYLPYFFQICLKKNKILK